MKKKESNTVKTSIDVPKDIKEIIQKIADAERRSFSGQLIYFAEKALKEYQSKNVVDFPKKDNKK